jgi:hypothetical protein
MRVLAASISEPSNPADASRGLGGGVQSEGNLRGSQCARNCRQGRSKAAREEARSAIVREGAIYAQAYANRSMVAAQRKKAALMEDKNMFLLMTMLDDKITTVEAREYMRLRRGDELKKLRWKLAAKEDRERTDTTWVVAIGTSLASNVATRGKGATILMKGWICNVAAKAGSAAMRGSGRAVATEVGNVAMRGPRYNGAREGGYLHEEGTWSQQSYKGWEWAEVLPRSQQIDEYINGDGNMTLAQIVEDDCSLGEAGARSHPCHNGRQPRDFNAPSIVANQEVDDWHINHGLGMWPQPSFC